MADSSGYKAALIATRRGLLLAHQISNRLQAVHTLHSVLNSNAAVHSEFKGFDAVIIEVPLVSLSGFCRQLCTLVQSV